jgi:hypothetical protein
MMTTVAIQTLRVLRANAHMPFPGSSSETYQGLSRGRLFMPNKVLWLITFFIVFFIAGVNTGELPFVHNVGTTICLSCIGVG